MDNNESKLTFWLITALNIGVSLFPFGLSVIMTLVYLAGGWAWLIDGHTLSYYFLPRVRLTVKHGMVFVVFFLVYFIILKTISLINNRGYKYRTWYRRRKKKTENIIIECFLVIIIACLIRYIILFVFKDQLIPFSDFNRVWEMANGKTDDHLAYYTLFPTYLNFSLIERFLINAFSFTYTDYLALNCVLSAFVAGLIFLISYEISGKETFALTASLLYSFTPSSIFCCYFGAPEQLVLVFNTAGLLFFIKAFNQKTYIRMPFSLVGGFLIGIGSAFKTFGIVIILAYLIILFLKSLNNDIRQRFALVKRLGLAFFCFVLAFTGYKCATTVILQQTEKAYHVELDYSNSIPHFLLVGLNTEGEGQIHLGTLSRQYYKRYLSNGNDIVEAKSFALQLLKEDLKNNKNEIGLNLGRKLIWSWQDDSVPLNYFLNYGGFGETKVKNSIFHFISNYGAEIFELFYFLVMLSAMIVCFSLIKKKHVNYGVELLLIIIIGYFFMMLLSESQSRYKSLIMPYICILSAFGFDCMSGLRLCRLKKYVS